MKKEYICPSILVKEVKLSTYFLGISNPVIAPGQKSACESWVDNMDDILSGKNNGHGEFGNPFNVNSEIWGDDAGAL